MSSGCDESDGPDEGVEESVVGSSWLSKAPKSQAKSRKSSTTSNPSRTPITAPLGPRRCAAGVRWGRGSGKDLGAVGRGAVGGQGQGSGRRGVARDGDGAGVGALGTYVGAPSGPPARKSRTCGHRPALGRLAGHRGLEQRAPASRRSRSRGGSSCTIR